MTRITSTRGITSARGLAAIAVLGIVALGGTSACASSATSPGSMPTGPVTIGTPTPTLLPLPTVVPPSPGPTGTAPGSAPTTYPGKLSPTPSGIKADSYTSNGAELSVHFFGGVCSTYSLQANQSAAGKVVVTILAAPTSSGTGMCPQLIRDQAVSVDLGAPLDGRSVVDAASGKTLPPTNPAPGGGRVTHGPVKQ
jgi:hypothetical protein